ncbi:hypothetical protein GCM10007966_16220 [Legionella impletisoli]|uniref:Uncharacterized protein n=1 Tax=Legionella impletisoli TaxID=343510 RepID=A0A917NDV7_9GAMM|nr:hypothetical protein GCM10007966_16220 [Legionella impletisoli]
MPASGPWMIFTGKDRSLSVNSLIKMYSLRMNKKTILMQKAQNKNPWAGESVRCPGQAVASRGKDKLWQVGGKTSRSK